MPAAIRPARAGRAALLAAIAALAPLVFSALATPARATTPFEPFSVGRSAQELVSALAAPPAGFQETVAFSGLTNPMAVRFAPDGRVFVAEKGGRIKVFDGLGDPTPAVYADLSLQVHDFWDRGLLGIALDPQWSTRPYVYVLYAYNKDPNSSQFPRWGDSCPTPPGANGDGCVISGRLSRLNGGSEQVLIEDWCQQYPSHSLGSLAFGADGALYVSAGDGASFEFADYGQDGSPRNPCGDPPGGVGGAMSPPSAEGGALRSQDVRSTGDPAGLDGSILRVNPDTGAALPDNPNVASPDPNARRIVAYGFRNPFRIAVRPGTSEIWAGDVGWNAWEEINRVPTPTAGMRNYGWPCYEGTGVMNAYGNLDLTLCESLYSQGAGAHSGPYYTYNHQSRVVTGETCGTGSSSISGLAFTPQASSFPAAYDGALFFADYSRDCIWAMLRGTNGLPDANNRQTFVAGAANPVDVQFGPGGDLFYVDLDGGNIRRVRSLNANRAPVADIVADPTAGAVPLTVAFDGSGSSDPDGGALQYAWDLDGDGAFDNSTAVTPSFTYTTAGTYTAQLRVSDPGGLSDTANVRITAGTPPVPVISIDSPAPGTTWKVDDTIAFSGSATDFQGNPIPASGLTWEVNLRHCDRITSSCHTHPLQAFSGQASGSFPAPDHEFPSHLEIELTATDTNGLSRTVTRRLDPETVQLTLASEPPGLKLSLGPETATAPFTREVIRGSTNGVGTETPQSLSGVPYTFSSWSNAGARNHTVAVNADTTLTATFERSTTLKLAGADVVGTNISSATPGKAEVYRMVAGQSGNASEVYLRLASDSTASALVLGLYADSNGTPTTLLGSGRLEDPVAGAWNKVPVSISGIEAGQAYWLGLLNPIDATGTLRWHDRAGGTGGAEQTSLSRQLASLPASWARDRVFDDGPVSGYVFGTPAGPPPPPALDVAPASLSFSGTAGGANPAAKTVSVANTGGGNLPFTASDDASWLTVSPPSGSAPRDLTVSVDTAGLAAGTHTATVRVESAGVSGSPKLIPVTLTLAAPQPPVLSVAPASLAFTATAGGTNPAAQSVSVSNTGGGTLSFTASDDASWLAATPASGTAPASVFASVNVAGLAAGTYTATLRIDAAGATGSPVTVPVTLTVAQAPPPQTGLVGAWGFDESSGTTASDLSGRGNPGTISGAVRTAGRYGGGLSFDGSNDWVTVADAASLDLTTGVTLEAWVRPVALGTTWRTVVIKEQPSQLAYALYAGTDTASRPSGHIFTTSDRGLLGPSALPLNAWSHLATTWDGLTLRLYVNGAQVASSALAGTAVQSSSPLRIGGNAVWPEWFSGVIDEVRVYNRALSAAEIAADRDTPIAGAGATLAAAQRSARASKAKRRKVARSKLRRDIKRMARRRRAHRTQWLSDRAARGAGARRRAARGSRGRRPARRPPSRAVRRR